jgi:Acetyltransferase (GNAT) family
MANFKIRAATIDDGADILALMQEVAPEIPVNLDGDEEQKKIEIVIFERCASGRSLVAVDSNSAVVGFVVARPDFDEGGGATFLDYVGVSKKLRGQGVFTNMMGQLKARRAPLIAVVLNGNQAHMADRLVSAGYAQVEANSKQAKYRWAPA